MTGILGLRLLWNVSKSICGLNSELISTSQSICKLGQADICYTTTISYFEGAYTIRSLHVFDMLDLLQSRKQEFVNALLDFVKQSGVASTLLLTGVSPLDRTDAQMM